MDRTRFPDRQNDPFPERVRVIDGPRRVGEQQPNNGPGRANNTVSTTGIMSHNACVTFWKERYKLANKATSTYREPGAKYLKDYNFVDSAAPDAEVCFLFHFIT